MLKAMNTSERSTASPLMLRDVVHASVPPLVPWRGFRRSCANLLVFAAIAIAATWVVHQSEYRLELAQRFSAGTNDSSIHSYMTPAGIILAMVLVGLLTIPFLTLRIDAERLRHLRTMLPARLSARLIVERETVSYGSLARTACGLLVAQVAMYLSQENLESALLGAGWPGLAVALAPHHATVIPLHVIAAVIGSMALWTAARWLGNSRRSLRLASLLVALFDRRRVPSMPAPLQLFCVVQQVLVDGLGLRAPPRRI